MKVSNKAGGIKAAILTMSFIQMATNAIAPILANISVEFPQSSIMVVQYLMTFPNLLVVITSIITGQLATTHSKRNLAVTGLALSCISGILSFLFHGRLLLLYVWAGLLGIGIGLVVPIATSFISDYFEDEEQTALLGFQTSAANVGSMLMTFLGGSLAVISWNYNYLVYLLAVPGLILTLLFIPKKNAGGKQYRFHGEKIEKEPTCNLKKQQSCSKEIPGFAWLYFGIAAIFMLLFYMGPTNLSILVEEQNIGNAMTAGAAATILLFGGSVMGLIFGKVAAKIGKNTIPVGFFILFLGYIMIYHADAIAMLYLGSFLVGTTNTLVLPQCMEQMVTGDKNQTTFLMSITFAVANLGTFFAPVLTGLSKAVMGNEMAKSRFLFTAIIAVILTLLSVVVLNKRHCAK